MKKSLLFVIVSVLLSAGCTVAEAPAREGARKLTPVMGWSSWNSFGKEVDAAKVRAQMDALVRLGLRDLGWTYVNIDDCFQNGRDATTGRLRVDERKFPGGFRAMRELVDYAHANGLKAGIYSDGGDHDCSSHQGEEARGRDVGFYRHEVDDANLYLGDGIYRDAWAQAHPEDPGVECWGFDFIKIDWCGGEHAKLKDRDQYNRIMDAIDGVARRTGRQKIVNICRWEYVGPWQFRADSWRIGPDIASSGDSWESVMLQVDYMKDLWPYTRPGSMNDPDMLVAGLKLTPDEDKSHFAMWCLFSAPLLIGQDLTTIRPETLELYRNAELIALDQDPAVLSAGYLGDLVPGVEVWVKMLGDARSSVRALALLNRTTKPQSVVCNYLIAGYQGQAKARDLFAHADLPPDFERRVTLPPHGIDVLRLEPIGENRVVAPRYSFGPGRALTGAKVEKCARVDWVNALADVRNGWKLIDVRTPEEFAAGHVEGAVNVPHVRVVSDVPRLLPDTNTPIVCYCRQYKRAAQAATVLDGLGYRRVHFVGDGYAALKDAPRATVADVFRTIAEIKGTNLAEKACTGEWQRPWPVAKGRPNRSWSGDVLSVAGRKYASGVGTCAGAHGGGSVVLCAVPDGAAVFVAEAGVDDASPEKDEPVRLEVHVDGVLKAASRPLTAGDVHVFAVPLEKGAKELKLITHSMEGVHVSWGGAGFVAGQRP